MMRKGRVRRGQALTELAIAIPVLALMIFGLIEVGFIIKTRLVLQDAVRAAVRYGSEAGTVAGDRTSLVAPLCQSDYYALDVIADRLKNSLVDPARVRAILIYAADQNGVPLTTGGTGLPTSGYTDVPVDDAAVHGDYYYATYNPSTGKNTAGSIYTLFNSGASSVFAPFGFIPPSDANGEQTFWLTHPPCGYTLRASAPLYDDSIAVDPASSPADIEMYNQKTLTPLVDPSSAYINTYPAPHSTYPLAIGNWPPAFRNNQGDNNGNPPDRYGVEIVYDYEFHTPIFNVFANFLAGSHHLFRVVDRAVFDLNPN